MARGIAKAPQWCHVQLQSTYTTCQQTCTLINAQKYPKPSGERIEGEADEIMKDEARDSLYTLATAPELHGKETDPTGEQHFSIEWRINHSDNKY